MANASDKNKATLDMYINDMHALQTHILEAVSHQNDDPRVKNEAQTAELVSKLKATLTEQVNHLAAIKAKKDTGTVGSAIKEGLGQFAGMVAGLYGKVRKDPVSRMLRDDYTALAMATISYTQLHTTGLAYHEQEVADVALKHLEALTPLVMRINEIMPNVVAAELTDEGSGIETEVADEAIENTQQAWKPQS